MRLNVDCSSCLRNNLRFKRFYTGMASSNIKYKAIKNEQEAQIKEMEQKAWDMMAPLNKLYDWDVFNRMMTQTVPRLEFDPYFTNQRLADLVNSYGWDENFSKERSVVYSHSGLTPVIIAKHFTQVYINHILSIMKKHV